MSFGETVLLGALAGSTIFLSLPVARLSSVGVRARIALAMFAVGVLAFLFADIFEHALEIVEEPVTSLRGGGGDLGEAVGLVALLAAGFAAGTAGIASVERIMRPKGSARPPIAGGAVDVMSLADSQRIELETDVARKRALQLGLTIAAAIGLHNFAEGLAIGVSAESGEITLATTLIVGFALHNATEGFGIIGPLGSVRPSWGWLLLAGLIGGGPVLAGAAVGYNVSSEPLELAFYGLAGGAVLYVIGEIWTGMRRFGHRELGLWLVAAGFMTGVITDLIVVYGGG